MSPKQILTARQILAAHRLVEDRMTEVEIAAEAGVCEKQLRRWKRKPEFIAKVRAISAKYDSDLLHVGLASRRQRVQALADRWHRMQTLIEERAADDGVAKIPGGKTGLLVRQYRMIGTGQKAEKVEEYAFDAALFRELRETEKQAAMELGQWVEKVAQTDPTGTREAGDVRNLPDEQLDDQLSAMEREAADAAEREATAPGVN